MLKSRLAQNKIGLRLAQDKMLGHPSLAATSAGRARKSFADTLRILLGRSGADADAAFGVTAAFGLAAAWPGVTAAFGLAAGRAALPG
eukprot:6659358-Karenia_brevis.AAC.1